MAAVLIKENSAQAPQHFAVALPGHRVIPVDGVALARRHGLGRIVNSVLLGALARAIAAPSLLPYVEYYRLSSSALASAALDRSASHLAPATLARPTTSVRG